MTGPIDTGAGPPGRTDLDTLPMETNEPGVDHSHLHHERTNSGGERRLFLVARMGAAPQPFAQLVLPLTRGAVHLADARGFTGIAFTARGTGRYALLLDTYGIEPRDSFKAPFAANEEAGEVRIPFSAFSSADADARLHLARLRALAVRLEGSPGSGASLELGNVRFYR
jgi:hypothetical protein